MKKIVVFCFLFLSISTYAQDSIYLKKTELLTQKAYQHYYTNKDSALFYFDEIINLAKENEIWEDFYILTFL